MKQRMFSTFMMILYFLALGVHASNDQATDENLKNFAKDLDERMKEIKEFAKDKSNEAYRIVCSKKGMKKMSKFVNLCQSKKKSTDSDKEVTIVKIMRYGNPENFDVEMLKKQFLYSAMEYLHYGKDYKPLGDTRITFEPILMSNLRDYDLVNTKVVSKTAYLNQINNLVVNEQAEITKVVCKQIILEKIKKCLVHLVDNSMKAHYTAEKLSETIDKYRNEILGDTGLVNPKTFKYSTWLLRLISKDSIFNNISDEAVKLGEKLIVKNSNNSKEIINSFIVYLLTVTQKNALDSRLKSILSLALSDGADNGSKAAFETLVTDAHVKMLQEFESKTITKPTDTKWDYVDNLAKEDGFITKLEDFYSVIKFDDIYKTLESSDEFKTNTFLRFADDSTTTLIFGDQLDHKTFNTFYDKVNRSNVLGKLDDYEHRLIFVESTTEKTWQGLVQGLGKNEKMMVKSFYASDSVLSYISKVKADDEGSTSNLHKPCIDQHLAHETTEDKTEISDNTTMCDTTISITDFEGFEGNQNLVEFLNKLADSFNQKSEYNILSKKMLTITTELGTSSVYLWSWQNKNTLRGKVSVLFNIYSKKGNCDDKGLSNRYFYCVDNFLRSDLIDLKHQLQAMLIKKCPIFEIPNILSINNAEHAYKVTSLHMSSGIDTRRELIRQVVNVQSSNFAAYYTLKISTEDILAFIRGKTLASESVKIFISNAGITEDALHRIFSKLFVVKLVNDTAKPNILPAFEFKTVYDVRLIHAVFKDKSSVLHICEVKNLGYSKFIMENITKMLLNSYEFTLKSPIPENCNNFINSIFPKINVAALILTDLLDFYCYDFDCSEIRTIKPRNLREEDLVDRITDRIYGLKKAQKKSKSNGTAANESLPIEEFKTLMEASIKEIAHKFMRIFEKSSTGHPLKLTSILLRGREGEDGELANHYKDMEMLPLGEL